MWNLKSSRKLLLRLAALLTAFLMVIPLAACGEDEEEPEPEEPEVELAEYPVVIGDYRVLSRPGSVVSLSPSITEKLCDLKLEDRLMGVSDYCKVEITEYCTYPAQIAGLPACGTAQLPDLDEIARLDPHLVLAESELPAEAATALQQLDIDVMVIPRPTSVAAWKESYRTLLRLLEGEYTGGEIGDGIAAELQQRLDSLNSRFGTYGDQNGRKPSLYLRRMDFIVATGDTLESELIEVIGTENVVRDYTGWALSEEEANSDVGRGAFEAVEVIFMHNPQRDAGSEEDGEPDEEAVTITMLEQSAYYKGLKATLQDWYLYIDCTVFERQGEKMLDLLEAMGEYAYPEASAAAAGPAPDGDLGDGGADPGDDIDIYDGGGDDAGDLEEAA